MIPSIVKVTKVEGFSTHIHFEPCIVNKGFKAVRPEPYSLALGSPKVHKGIHEPRAVTSGEEGRPSMDLSFVEEGYPHEGIHIFVIVPLNIGYVAQTMGLAIECRPLILASYLGLLVRVLVIALRPIRVIDHDLLSLAVSIGVPLYLIEWCEFWVLQQYASAIE